MWKDTAGCPVRVHDTQCIALCPLIVPQARRHQRAASSGQASGACALSLWYTNLRQTTADGLSCTNRMLSDSRLPMARQLCRIAQTAVAYLAHLMVHLAHIQPSQYTLRKSGHAARPRHRQDDPSGDATSCQSHNMLGHAHAGSRGRIRRPDTCGCK